MIILYDVEVPHIFNLKIFDRLISTDGGVFMDNIVLKKRLSSYRTEGGRLSKVGDDVLIDLLRAWESWTGTSKEFYRSLGLSKQQLAIMIRKGKKLLKSGSLAGSEFKEIKLDAMIGGQSGMGISIFSTNTVFIFQIQPREILITMHFWKALLKHLNKRRCILLNTTHI